MRSDDEPSVEHAAKPGLLSRRNLIVGGAAAAVAAAGGAAVLLYHPRSGLLPSPSKSSRPTKARPGPAGVYPGPLGGAPIDEAAVPRWRADVDMLVAQGQNLIRTSVYAWLVAPAKFEWNPEASAFYRDALGYARDRGLAVNMVLPGSPDWSQGYSFDEYAEACSWFWTSMRDNYDDMVDLWQPYNEADHSHYQKFTAAPREDSADYARYLGEFGYMLGVAKEVLGQNGTPVTTNLTGWPMNDEREKEWYTVLDAIQPALDVLSIDLYPADSETEIALLAQRIERVRQRYDKPVFIAEIGLQTTPGSWTESDQRKFVPAAIKTLRTGKVWGICLYELRDNESPAGFGIVRQDGSQKPGFEAVMQAMAPR